MVDEDIVAISAITKGVGNDAVGCGIYLIPFVAAKINTCMKG